MKKLLLVVLVLTAIPVMAFSDFQIGATAIYNNDIMDIGKNGFTTNDLVYGLETRLKLWIIQAGVSAMYQPPVYEGDITTILIPTDLGVALDVWFLRFGLGLGPVFGYSAGGEGIANTGLWNLRVLGDINIGNLCLGVVGYYFADSFRDFGASLTSMPVVGVSVLFKLF